MKLLLQTTSFKPVLIPGVIPSSISYNGNIEGYDLNDLKSLCYIKFSLDDTVSPEEVIQDIKSKFCMNPDTRNVDDYILVSDDKTRITIKSWAGSRGWSEGISFSFQE